MKLRRLGSLLLDIIFPKYCVGCRTIGTYLCYSCYETIEFAVFPITQHPEHLDSVVCCTLHSGVSKKLITELKYKSIKSLAKTAAEILFYSTNIPNVKYITYVPMHWKKKNMRGFNQSQLIAEFIAEKNNRNCIQVLQKIKETSSQMSQKSKEKRMHNLQGSMQYVETQTIQNKEEILLFDDVYTTGSTLNNCAQLLKENGWKKVHGVCFSQRN